MLDTYHIIITYVIFIFLLKTFATLNNTTGLTLKCETETTESFTVFIHR